MTAIPKPEAGLVISYSYLWNREHQVGRDEGCKDRPVVIILAVEPQDRVPPIVTVLPITHSAPTSTGAAVEIPQAIKRHLRLDAQPSWVVVSEGNEFVWPGYDLRTVPLIDRYDYGFLPPRFFRQILAAFLTLNPTGNAIAKRD